jgi:hypothetical protein
MQVWDLVYKWEAGREDGEWWRYEIEYNFWCLCYGSKLYIFNKHRIKLKLIKYLIIYGDLKIHHPQN